MPIRFRTLSAAIAFSLLGLPLGAQQSQDPGATPAPVPQNQKMSKQQKQKMKKTLKELDSPYRTWLEEDVVYIITPDERNAFLQLRPTKNANSPLTNSGCAAEAIRPSPTTISRKSITAASPTPMSTSLPESRVGKPTAAASTLSGASPTRSNRIRPVAPMTARWKRAGD